MGKTTALQYSLVTVKIAMPFAHMIATTTYMQHSTAVWHDPDPDTQAQGTGYRYSYPDYIPTARTLKVQISKCCPLGFFGGVLILNLYQRCSSCSWRDKERSSDVLIAGAVSRVDRALAGAAEMWELR